jgi:hypothetical protein
MKKLLVGAALAIGLVCGMTSMAQAQLVNEYGQGSDCPPPEPTAAPCPYPADPTVGIEPLVALDPVWAGVGTSSGGGIGVFAQVGEEERLGFSLGRVGVDLLGAGHLARIYIEDFTGGNSIANTGETVNEFFGCIEGTPFMGCDPTMDDPNDASLTTIG